jgi:hypothetical protein
MLLVVSMKNGCNDNEPISFSQIGLAAALVLNKLRVKTQLDEQKIDDGHGEADAGCGRNEYRDNCANNIEQGDFSVRRFNGSSR